MFVVVIVRPVQGRVKQALAGARWGPEQRGRAPTRDAPTGGGWIPAYAGMTGSGILGFDNPWWLRGGPSSQSSPGGRRGKTSRPHPCLSPVGGLRAQGKPQASWTLADPSQSPRPHPAPLPPGEGPEQRGRAPTRDAPTGGGWIPACAGMTGSGILGFDDPWWLRGGPSSQSSPGGRRGKTSRPHPCLSPAGGLRAQGKPQASWTLADPSPPRPSDAPGGACPLSVSPRGGEVWGRPPRRGRSERAGESRLAPTGGGEEARPPSLAAFR